MPGAVQAGTHPLRKTTGQFRKSERAISRADQSPSMRTPVSSEATTAARRRATAPLRARRQSASRLGAASRSARPGRCAGRTGRTSAFKRRSYDSGWKVFRSTAMACRRSLNGEAAVPAGRGAAARTRYPGQTPARRRCCSTTSFREEPCSGSIRNRSEIFGLHAVMDGMMDRSRHQAPSARDRLDEPPWMSTTALRAN